MKDIFELLKVIEPKMLGILDDKIQQIFSCNNLNFAKYIMNWRFHLKKAFKRCEKLGLMEVKNLRILDLATGVGFFPFILSEDNMVYGTENILCGDLRDFYLSIHRIFDLPCDYFKIEKQIPLPINRKFDIITSFSIRWDMEKNSKLGTKSGWEVRDCEFILEDLISHLNPGGKICLEPFERSMFKKSQKYFETKFGQQVRIL